jgi:hypothetical protein
MYETQTEFLEVEYPWIYNDLAMNYTDAEIDNMSRAEVLEGYMRYNGVIRFSDSIITCIEALFYNDTTKQRFDELRECDFDCKLDGSEKEEY